MSNLNIAIVGTDTAAGKLLLEKLEESSMEIEVLYPLEKLPEDYSSIRFRKKTCLIEKLDDFDFTSVSLVFFTGSRKNISEHITRALESGCYVIDDTGAEVPDYDVLTIIPEINGDEIAGCRTRLFRSPHAVTIQTALAMNEIISQFGLESLDITSFEAVSGEGQPAVTELANQAISLFNTIPSMVDFESGESYSDHEKQILGEIENFLPQISGRVCVNSFFVPVFYGHSTLFSFSTSMPVSVEEIRQVLADSSMISYVDREVVTPVTHGVSRDLPVVTRLRRSTAGENQFNLFSVIDNSLKGEVLNCIQIAEKIIEYIG